MLNISEETRKKYLDNLRLINERAQVEPEVVDLIEAFARLELDRGSTPQFYPPEPQRLSGSARAFLRKNDHLSLTARNFLATYCQRLQEQGLKFILNPLHLAGILSVPLEKLHALAGKAEKAYFTYHIPKRDGRSRTIHAPYPRLKSVQRSILDEFLTGIPLRPEAEGFRKNRSIVTNSRRHIDKKVVIRLDLEDFFPSITSERVFGLFQALGYTHEVSSLLTRLTTYRGALATGAPSSPAISNLVCRRLDRRLFGLGEKMKFQYSRYADDLAFSSQNSRLAQLLPFLREIIRDEGFEVNRSKTRILRSGGQQKVTGIIVNRKPNIARKEIRILRAILHNCRQGGIRRQAYKYAKEVKRVSNPQSYPLLLFKASLRGKIDHIRQVNPEIGEKLLNDFLGIRFPA